MPEIPIPKMLKRVELVFDSDVALTREEVAEMLKEGYRFERALWDRLYPLKSKIVEWHLDVNHTKDIHKLNRENNPTAPEPMFEGPVLGIRAKFDQLETKLILEIQ